MKKFEDTGIFTNIERLVHHSFARSAVNIAIVSECVAGKANVLIPPRSQELGLSYGTFWSILHLDLHLHPYKVQLTQKLASQLIIHNVVDTWNGCFNDRRCTAIFRTKFSSAMKRISHSLGM